MKRYGLYNHPQARIIGEMIEVEFGTWVRYEDVAALETKYSEAVELIKEMEKQLKTQGQELYVKICTPCHEKITCDGCSTRNIREKAEKMIALLKRHKGEA